MRRGSPLSKRGQGGVHDGSTKHKYSADSPHQAHTPATAHNSAPPLNVSLVVQMGREGMYISFSARTNYKY